MQQANIINVITNKYEPQQKHRLGMVSKITGVLKPVLRDPNLALGFVANEMMQDVQDF